MKWSKPVFYNQKIEVESENLVPTRRKKKEKSWAQLACLILSQLVNSHIRINALNRKTKNCGHYVWLKVTIGEWMLKAPPLISSNPHLSVIKCNCWTYGDNIGPRLKKPSFVYFQPFLNIFFEHIDCNKPRFLSELVPYIDTYFYHRSKVNPYNNIKRPSIGPILEARDK